jgi:hypothetical protein
MRGVMTVFVVLVMLAACRGSAGPVDATNRFTGTGQVGSSGSATRTLPSDISSAVLCEPIRMAVKRAVDRLSGNKRVGPAHSAGELPCSLVALALNRNVRQYHDRPVA